MTAANGMNNMALAHEIAVEKDFKLQKVDPPDNSIHKLVKETLHRAFWEKLDAELKEVPPNFTQAMVLLEDVKENFMLLLLPYQTKLKEHILEILDADLIRQQAEKGILDFQHYAQYVISLMGKLCAPIRDEKVSELTQIQGVVPMFKGILETLDIMKLDMANFTINVLRPDIIAISVDYEKNKFAEFLKIQTDGLQYTRKWLLQHLMNARNYDVIVSEDKIAIHNLTACILEEAYLELLEWDDLNPYPETLMMDQARFTDLGNRFYHLVVIGSVLLVTAGTAQSLQGVAAFKNKLKQHITVLLENIYTNKDLEKIMPNIAEQVIMEVAEGLETYGFKPLDSTSEKLLKGQIVEIVKDDHKIRELVRVRVREFIQQTISLSRAVPLRVPPGLSSLQTELAAVSGQFLRLVSHNRAVFGEYYADIIANGVSASASASASVNE
ncbi:T-complex protein 11-like protein 1 [Zootermopsis nevadensis]|uniref:T-complex protein 11-like protein 1 n=1 Tax=Zootermopsis nevadensis TaxID=136037 RepID=A0A067QYV7_ZOONE|nr:T-complex protein 11-like protein 1 [Zootermopsis nevadensis]KDR14701.1 T-complex protein 11-like protein 1 [Zootermopsis nevadensis]